MSDLNGLINLLNIRYLNISNNSIDNLNVLTSLIHLRELYADNINISDIAPLFKMKGIKF